MLIIHFSKGRKYKFKRIPNNIEIPPPSKGKLIFLPLECGLGLVTHFPKKKTWKREMLWRDLTRTIKVRTACDEAFDTHVL